MQTRFSKKIEIQPFGFVLFETSTRAKHINISIKSLNSIRVAIPIGVSYCEAYKFFSSKLNWTINTLNKIKLRSKQIECSRVVDVEYAKRFLLNRLEELAKEHSFTYNKATIRNQKTRWGSCSAKNNISLNMQLINLPDKLIDYVILHELVHTYIKNHSRLFWLTLENYLPNSKILDQSLKKYYLT